MVNYTCPRCGYEINIKKKYCNHLRRKKLCENKVSDDNLINEYIKFNITEKLSNFNSTKMTPSDPEMTPNDPQMARSDPEMTLSDPEMTLFDPKKFKYECEYCYKVLSKNCHLHRHLKVCKVRKEKEREKEEMNKVVELLNKQLEDQKQQINELIKKTGNTTTNITYQQNNVNNNFKLLGYRNTDISHLSDKDFISCISHSNFCIPHLIKKIHFDPDKPENHNIYISNIKNNYAMTYDGDKWNLTNRDDIINDILEEKEIIIEEKLEEWLEKGKKYPEIMKKFTRYLEKKEHDVVLDKIKDEIKLVLFNNRNLIKN